MWFAALTRHCCRQPSCTKRDEPLHTHGEISRPSSSSAAYGGATWSKQIRHVRISPGGGGGGDGGGVSVRGNGDDAGKDGDAGSAAMMGFGWVCLAGDVASRRRASVCLSAYHCLVCDGRDR